MYTMKFHEISELISLGEGESIEFKSSLGELKEIGETVCAFLNKRGGIVLVGVSDEGRILGVEIGIRTLERLSNFLLETIKPKPLISINLKAINNKIIILVEVPEGSDKPYFFKGRAFIRVDATNRIMARDEILELAKNIRRPFDMLPLEEKVEVEERLVREVVEKASTYRRMRISYTTLEDVLKKLGVWGKNAQALLFSPDASTMFPHAKIKIMVTRRGVVIDERVIEGPLITQLRETLATLKQYFFKGWEVTGLERREVWEYPLEAVREGIVNALIHRDYYITSPIFIRLEDYSLTIYNPGTLPKQLDVEDLYKDHPSIPRNPLLAKTFYYYGLFEEWGTGTLRIIDACRKARLPQPIWRVEQGFTYLTLQKWEELLTESEKKILEILHKKRSVDEIVTLVGLTERRIRDLLKKLEERGLIAKEKIGRRYYYYATHL
ncbi:MAG: hypothetical protein DRJ47_01730 [Thermoprotei archaeon]|nr:MAG: hypothetical protein DRJ47_01730 [Thermoprotei archaeon]